MVDTLGPSNENSSRNDERTAATGGGTATRETANGLFRLLLEFAEHSSRPVLDVESFENTLWFADVPAVPACLSRSWGPREDLDPEIWLQVKKEPEPPCPAPPEVCRPWLREEPPFADDEIPLLLERIPRVAPASDVLEGQGQEPQEPAFLKLDEHPEVDAAWARYLEERWAPWAHRHRPWREQHRVYATLFHMRQTLLREGERFEAVLALGLLHHRSSRGRIRRHLVTLPVNIEFDADRGVFRVSPPPDGGRANLELDMLPEEQRPDAGTLRALEEAADQLSADPWDEAALSGFLRSFVQSIDHRGEYLPDDRPLPHPTDHAVVVRAPAIIIRRRTTRSMSAMFRRILQQLAAGGEIPPAIRLLVDARSATGPAAPTDVLGEPPAPILFPKPANDEQRQIIERLQRGLGVLVQGPPGTGKSHTIANLLSHLLAQGRRVLVTAQTPRALKVLKEKIPQSIQPLCVSALGNDRASLDILQKSVQEIIGRETTWNEEQAEARIAELKAQLDEIAEQLAGLDHELRQLREAETVPREVAGGSYRGTPQRIAERIAREAATYSWFSDIPPDPEASLELGSEDLLQLLELLRGLPATRREELAQAFPAAEDVPSADELADLVQGKREAREQLEESRNGGVPEETLQTLEQAPDELAGQLVAALERLNELTVTARNRPLPWVATAVKEVLAGDDTPWVELRSETAKLLEGLAEEAHEADRHDIERPADVPLSRLLADAEDLYERLHHGRNVNWLTRRLDPVVRRTAYLGTEVRIGGRLCDSESSLRRLVQHLRFEQRLESLWQHWRQWSPRTEAESFTRQVGRLTENLEALDQVLEIYPALEEAKALVSRVAGLPQPAWHDDTAFQGFLRACRARMAQQRLATIGEQLRSLESRLIAHLERPNPHPITGEILRAVRELDAAALIELRRTLRELHDDAARLERCEAALQKAAEHLPRLVAKLRENPDDSAWEKRLRELPAAWRWAGAKEWLRRLNEPGRLERLTRRSLQLRSRQLELTEELASLLSWRNFFKRLTPEHHRHLAAWQQAVKRLGKGTGRHAPRHRRDAREHLQHCREAIPAWIMPLHQVYDTIAPEPGMFDVVIVDEASQCSLDSLSLLYLAQRIVIVGDDEQISPTVLRFDHSEFVASVRRHIGEFGLASVFQPDTSLFDLGRVWFGTSRVQLREHFRCMPEIIRFSDRLCYGNLVPLRQYPPKRLTPIRTRHVKNGYRRGSGQRVINPPEAEAVVEAVAACCADPAYQGKTMGVISLLGSAQAREIERRLLDRLDSDEIERRRLVCGDAYSFQGDERDVMFLSMVTAGLDETGRPVGLTARTRKSEKQRFNVAASRARDQMWLFHTPTLDELGNPEDLRRLLLSYCLSPGEAAPTAGEPDLDQLRRAAASPRQREGDPPKPFESWFEVDVYILIRNRGFRAIPQFPVAGYRIDLVVEDGQRRLAVECDGDAWHGPDRFQADLHRQRQLERAGWTFWRVRGSEFYADPAKAMEGLWALLTELGIHPLSRGAGDENTTSADEGTPSQRSNETPSPAGSRGTVEPMETPEATTPGPEAGTPGQDAQPDVPADSNGPAPAPPEPIHTPQPPPMPRSTPIEPAPRQPAPVPQEPAPVAKTLGAAPFIPYAGHPLPDPHTATGRALQDGLVAIVEAEGPIVHERLLRIYAQSAGFKRTGRQIRERLKRPLAAALRQGRLIREYQDISGTTQIAVYRTPTQKRAPLRAAGDRTLQEIPPAELEAVIRSLRGSRANRPVRDLESFLRLVLGFYGMRRLTSGARAYLEFVYKKMLTR